MEIYLVLIDKTPLSVKMIGELYGIDGRTLNRQYKTKISNFTQWRAREHAKDYLIYPKNITKNLSIDETAFTNGDLYTIVIPIKFQNEPYTVYYTPPYV